MLYFFKVRVEAYDQGSPSKTNVTVVILTVKSNYQSPVFNRASYFERIPETQSLGQQIIAVFATDGDALVGSMVLLILSWSVYGCMVNLFNRRFFLLQ